MSAAQAGAFLRARFDADVEDVTGIGHGEWSRAYAFRTGERHYIARFGAYREDFEKDRLAVRYASPALPIPVVVDIGEAFGGHYAISERAFGGFIDEVDGPRMRSLLPAFFAALDAARCADLTDSTGFGGWGADGHGAYPSWRAALLDVDRDEPGDRIQGWRERMKRSTICLEAFDEGLAKLHALAPFCPEERHLIHSDLLHFNVLVSGDRISAVFDWGCSLYGDFLYDLAWFIVWAPWYPAWRDIDLQREAANHFAEIGLAVPHFEERLRACQLHIGLDGMRYNAFVGNWTELESIARRTLAIARDER